MVLHQVVGVCGLLIEEGKALVVRRSKNEKYFSGYYELPGGSVDFGEHPDAAVVREFEEETGIRTRMTRPYGIFMYTDGDRHSVEVLYVLEALGDKKVTLSEEHDEYCWVTLAELDSINITPEMKENVKKGFLA